VDYAAAGLLDGLEGEDRQARLEFLDSLAEAGFSLEQMQAACAENRLALLPVERVLGGSYTSQEFAERTGLPVDTLVRVLRLLGLPEPEAGDPVFRDEDLEAFSAVGMFAESGLSQKSIEEIARVLGEAMARVSQAIVTAFAEAFLKPGDTELDVGWRFADLAQRLNHAVDPLLVAAYRAHLLEWVRLGMISQAELAAGQLSSEVELAVGFADLVGFTRLGGELEPGELDKVVGQFGALAAEVAGRPKVRLVKMIGDAAMFSSTEPDRLLAAALDLVAACEQADLPSLRVGVAFGTTVPRAGDLYGAAVNLASRVTGVARPGSVLCTQEIRDAAADQFDWSFARRHRLKGLGDAVPLWRARRLDDAAPTAPTRRR